VQSKREGREGVERLTCGGGEMAMQETIFPFQVKAACALEKKIPLQIKDALCDIKIDINFRAI
jgi:hypothetical protein